jgi:hypothetical protein
MDIQRVNEVLRKAVNKFEQDELADLREYMAEQENGEGDLDALSSAGEMFMSYIADLATDIAGQFGISDDEALDAVLTVADDLAASGQLPDVPDVDSAGDEEMSTWTGAAKTADLARRVIEFVKEGVGAESLVRGTSSGVA